MDWSSQETGEAIVCAPQGRVDEANWQEFRDGLTQAVRTAAGRSRPLVIDMAGIDYMSSRGLRALTLAKREADEAKVGVTLAAPNSIVREILAISRYDKLFVVEAALEAALQAEEISSEP
jgi:anti-sigma B factor antagonist